ncbi:MAG: helix-turn-helix transcriptional regulator [Abditibacteriota bacterium]|nr:helix-turn-helix transcriptional regulator [Abditibacteriota bacterium]
MYHRFDLHAERTIEGAGRCYFKTPAGHPDRILPFHCLAYIEKGEMGIGQEDESFLVRENQLLILQSALHHYPVSSCAPGTKTIYVHFYPVAGDLVSARQTKGFLPSLVDCSQSPRIKTIFDDITFFAVTPCLNKNVILSSLCRLLLSCLYEVVYPTPTSDPVVLAAVSDIMRSPGRFLTEEELADIAGVSVRTLRKHFTACFGMTPRAWQMEQKLMDISSTLLSHTNITLRELADNYGFCDEFYLSRCFKARFGTSPGRFRKNNLR